MDAVFSGVLDLLQAVSLPQTGRSSAGKETQRDGDPFAKLMEQQRQLQQEEGGKPADSTQQTTEAPEAEAPVQESEQEEVGIVAEQMQMAWAALAIVNPPVQQPEVVVAEAEAQPVVVEVATELTVDVEAQPDLPVLETLPEPAEEAVMLPVEMTEAAPESAEMPEMEMTQVAELPQAEAPDAVELPERIQTARVESPAAEEESELVYTVEEAVEAPQPLFRDTKAIPVKVGEAELPQQATEPVDRQLTKPLMRAIEQGESRVAVQLTPEALGSVRVEITRSSDGTLYVSLSAERAQTQGLLEKHADSLRSLLAAGSQDIVRVEVQRQEESAAYQPYDGRNGHNQNQQQQSRQDQRQKHTQHGQDFMQQLRLGLVPLDEG